MNISKSKKYKLMKMKSRKNKKYYGGATINENNDNLDIDFNVEGGNTNLKDEKDRLPPGVISEIADGIRNSTTPVLTSLAKSIATGANAFADNLKIGNKNTGDKNTNSSKTDAGEGVPGILGLGYQTAQNMAVKTIDSVNDIIQKKQNEESIIGAVARTAEIGKNIIDKSVDKFNETLNSPDFKDKIEETSEIAAKVVNKVVDNLDEPLEKFADKIGVASAQAASGVTSGVIKVVTDAAAAVPGVGAAVELGKIANDATASAASVVEAAKNSVDAFTELTNNVANFNKLDKLDKLDKLSKLKGGENKEYNDFDNLTGGKKIQNLKKYISEKNKIIERTNKSIDDFMEPTEKGIKNIFNNVKKAKTNKRLLKRKAKSKKVRFFL
jgi:hypothetical protein